MTRSEADANRALEESAGIARRSNDDHDDDCPVILFMMLFLYPFFILFALLVAVLPLALLIWLALRFFS